MSRSRVPTVVLLAAAAIVALLIYGVVIKDRGKGSSALDNQVAKGHYPMAPKADLSRPLLTGSGTQTIAAMRGKIVVLNFFASWCDPCVAEAPVMQKVQTELTRDGSGTVLGVTYHDATDAAAGFLQKHGLSYPTVTDPGDALFKAYGDSGIPETMVIDRQGRIVAISRGQIDQGFMDAALKKARAA